MAQSLLTECFGDEAVVLRIIFTIKTRAQRSSWHLQFLCLTSTAAAPASAPLSLGRVAR